MAGQDKQNANLANPDPDGQFAAGPASGLPGAWLPWQSLFLARLSRFLNQEEDWRLRVPAGDWRMRLIHQAIYSTYCDCVALSMADAARELVRRHRSSSQA